VLDQSGFKSYGRLVLAFDRKVNAADLTVTLSPTRPAQLSVSGVTQLDDLRIQVALSTYHLPIDYTAKVNGPSFSVDFPLSGLGNGSRVAFLTEATGNGDLDSWSLATGATSARDAGDRICQAEANAANLKGTFRALISADGSGGTYDAACQALGFSGTWASNCGQAQAIEDKAPFISMQGVPVVNGVSGIASGEWLTPVRYVAKGTVATPTTGLWFAWTGSDRFGRIGSSSNHCAGWQSSSGTDRAWMAVSLHEDLFDQTHSLACNEQYHLMCVQSGTGFFPQATLHVRSGKQIFFTSTEYPGVLEFPRPSDTTLKGLAAADKLCQSAAKELPNPEEFIAWLSDADNDAICRVLGLTGKRGTNNCGLGTLPASGPWVRSDGLLVAESASQLVSGILAAPILLDEKGAHLASARAWTGTDYDGKLWIGQHCSNWASDAATGSMGIASSIAFSWTRFTAPKCSNTARLICLRR
jgi:hypothetical protein